MLFKSLQYFWLRFWGAARNDHRLRISGETYWLYRLHADAFLFSLTVLGIVVSAVLATAPEQPAGSLVALACIVAVVGAVDARWLRIQLREQREFAELFYG